MKHYHCSYHEPKNGYTTVAVHQQYCDQNPENSIPVDDTSNEYNLMASDDHNDPLHFWQLYSRIGKEPIIELITDFYTRVFDDHDHPWFRDAFTRLAPLEHHIITQSQFWMDAMGGGRCYHGGEYRLHIHHQHNASTVMTAAGAQRWMVHMRAALDGIEFDDPRVKPCIMEFLRTKMMKYADQFAWDFDESDFALDTKDQHGGNNNKPLQGVHSR